MVLVVMGVSGSGKTTVAAILARRLGWPFEEGDVLHPQANVRKMMEGRPLTDGDRAPWLQAVAGWVDARLDAGEDGIITCSALKRRYRDLIGSRRAGVAFIHLAGSKETIATRLAQRRDHFMPPALLDSQLADLEAPRPDEAVLTVDIAAPPDAIAQEIIDTLGLS